ncbi:MAG: hypothetical protein ACLQUY_19715 [Ktedonobacterales bacterium]
MTDHQGTPDIADGTSADYHGEADFAGTSLSALDSNRFGITVARNPTLTDDKLAATNEFCRLCGVDLLIARCATTDTVSVTALEEDGFRLMDTLIYWRLVLTSSLLPEVRRSVHVRVLRPSDTDAEASIASQAFCSYEGHYHSDNYLNRDACTEVYVSWATRCSRDPEVADEMLGAEVAGQLVGFVALKRLSAGAVQSHIQYS